MSKFTEFRDAVTKRIQELYALNPNFVRLGISNDYIWEAYLEGFANSDKQYHNCDSCRSFLTRFGKCATVVDGKLHYVLDVQTNEDYQPSVDKMMSFLKEAPIEGFYLTKEPSYSKKSNITSNGSAHGPGVTFKHLYVDFQESCPLLSRPDGPAEAGKRNEAVEVLKRASIELHVAHVDALLELHGDKMLPRGTQYVGMLNKLRHFLINHKQNPLCFYEKDFDLSLYMVWNSAIGTFLRDLASGKDMLKALHSYGAMVDGANYKRPKSIVTTKQVDQAKETLEAAGCLQSLYRRHATAADIDINNCLYVNAHDGALDDVFGDMKKEVTEDPGKYINSPEMAFSDFVGNIDKYSSVKVLFTNNLREHTLNLLTAVDPKSPFLFPWNNPFSIAYAGNFADSVKERVKRAGGKVDGILRCSLAWKNTDDLDIHVYTPKGNHIYYGNKDTGGGSLDVDMNVRNPVTNAVENIIFDDLNSIQEGKYKVVVNNYTLRTKSDQGYTIEVESDGRTHEFNSITNPNASRSHTVIEFTWTKAKGLTIAGQKSIPKVLDHWGVKTNRFYDVEHIMFSPNYWSDYEKGNRHVIFTIPEMRNDEKVRPFFNEFLDPQLVKHNKRAFEVLGSRLLIEPSDSQLAGIGFSDAKDNFIVVSFVENGKRRIFKLITNK